MGKWDNAHTVGLFATLLGILASDWALAQHGYPFGGWLATMFLMTIFLGIAGHSILGMWRGALIDSSNCISLSRFQMVLWTTIVLSAFLAAAMWNIAANVDTPLTIVLPKTVWILMGISTTSFVGSPLILSDKQTYSAPAQDQAQMKLDLAKQGDDPSDITTKGLIVVNKDPKMARWSDLITGEEVVNAAHMDLSRVQMLFFTIIVAFSYAVALGHRFAAVTSATAFGNFPELDDGALGLLGISHAGYLISKGVPKGQATRTSSADATPAPATSAEEHLECCSIGTPTNPTPDSKLPAARGGVALS